MRRSTSLFFFLLAFTVLSASAQSPYTSVVSFCPAGVHANGFLDWTKLPASPSVPIGQQGQVTTTIPVSGVPNLTATVTIQGAVAAPNNPLYKAVNSSDLFVGVLGGTPVSITFSQPVQGFSVVFQTYGRSTHGFHMIANDANGNSSNFPAPAEVDSSGYHMGPDQMIASPLQIMSSTVGLVSATFGFDGDPYENYSFHLINFGVQTVASDLSKQIPLNGLQAWFRSDMTGIPAVQAGEFPGQPLPSWPDQSGNGHDATAPNNAGAAIAFDGPNCTPVLSFNGTQKFNFNLPINGWTGMTTFVVAQSYADGTGSSNAALFWDENAPWGETFVSPFQTSVWYRFGTGQPGNQPNYSRPADIGGNFSITTTIHNASTDSLYVDGVLAQQVPYRYSPVSGTVTSATIGSGYRGTGFTGNLGEILVYDRALSDTERERVEQYLRAKFGTM